MSAVLAPPDGNGISVITLLNPPMNALAPSVLSSLKACLTQAQSDAGVKAIVVTGEGGKFSAGFDITFLAKQQATGDTSDFGSDVNAFLIQLLESGAKPTVAGARSGKSAESCGADTARSPRSPQRSRTSR
jgi:enoyl-CoA hydratase/3-hydroxyacyl-CoA dehydrogenase